MKRVKLTRRIVAAAGRWVSCGTAAWWLATTLLVAVETRPAVAQQLELPARQPATQLAAGLADRGRAAALATLRRRSSAATTAGLPAAGRDVPPRQQGQAAAAGQVPLHATDPSAAGWTRSAAASATGQAAPQTHRATPRQAYSPLMRGQSPVEEYQSGVHASRYDDYADSDGSANGAYAAGQVPLGSTDPTSTRLSRSRQAVPVQYTAPVPPPGSAVRGPLLAPGGAQPGYAPPGGLLAPETLPPPAGYVDTEELFPQGSPFLPGEQELPTVDPVVEVTETQTGKLMLGVGINSNAGVVGQVILDEQNFDWRRFPRSWEEVRNGSAFRGAGQQLRIEALPGNQVSRYMFTFREPYLRDTAISFGLSGFFFNRRYRDWDEERLGGTISLGYQFIEITPDLSGSVQLRMENVEISNPRLPTPPELARVVGDNGLYSGKVALAYDTRDSTFLPTEGGRIELGFEQAFGDFDFPRGTIEARRYFMMHERPDGSGRHVLSLGTDVGFSGTDTPIFENFFAGGFTTLRGFRFREASPRNMGVLVGGRFQFVNTVEYMFPITADDALRGVVFCDFGTVEQDIEMHSENFRVSPGVGLRITIPALGPAPIALDLAFPVARADEDRIQNFSFFVGFGR